MTEWEQVPDSHQCHRDSFIFRIKQKTLAGSLVLTENKQAYVITAWHMLNPIEELYHKKEKMSEDSPTGH